MSTYILVPMDGAPLSKKALEVALSEHDDAEFTVLHVIDPADPGYSYPIDVDVTREPLHGSEAWYERAEELADELFDDARETADDYGVDLETELVAGSPARVIVDYAADHDVDHIIMGSHGRDEKSRILLGSVTETVAFRSPVRVTLVR
ncbi:universal stress protein [Natrinema marinum]|uniref:universal stress protein n=1 Tax=Natrinema marinum TaxID=2961598 RepID=UPI0020C8D4C9|nr:universal stress protein [Natrinema marinum]